jgi:hypothetical protein
MPSSRYETLREINTSYRAEERFSAGLMKNTLLETGEGTKRAAQYIFFY